MENYLCAIVRQSICVAMIYYHAMISALHKRRDDKFHAPACLACQCRQWRTQRLVCVLAIYNARFIMFISAKIATLLLSQRGRSRARCVTSPLAVAV